MITETDDLKRALDDAARRWPTDGHDRARLLRRLLAEGHRALVAEQAGAVAARLDAVRETSGALSGTYGDRYLDLLREDWPA
jgi:hypothetical protein